MASSTSVGVSIRIAQQHPMSHSQLTDLLQRQHQRTAKLIHLLRLLYCISAATPRHHTLVSSILENPISSSLSLEAEDCCCLHLHEYYRLDSSYIPKWMHSLNTVAAYRRAVVVDAAVMGANLEVEAPSYEEESVAVDTQQAFNSGSRRRTCLSTM